MKKYDSYKDSGIEWIGEIPSHWNIYKVKNLIDKSLYYQVGDGDHGSIKPEMYQEFGIPYIRVQNLSWSGKLILENVVFISEEIQSLNPKSKLLPNDILIAKTGATVGKLGLITDDIAEANTTSSVGKLTVDKNRFFPKYILYSFQADFFQKELWLKATEKSAQPGFNIDDFVLFKIASPQLSEQTTIANYLDYKTTQIDDLIAKKERLIQLLEEERTAIINQAVTKGLDPTVPMKDSGIEWLGEIPAHWEVKKLAFEFQSLNTKRIPLSAEERGRMDVREYDYYGASGVIDKVENYLFEEDLILIGEDGANLVTRSKRLVFIASGKYWVNNHAHIIKPTNGNINYFCELLELIDYTVYISGSAQPKLTQEALMSIKIPVPPPSEQNLIFNFLERELETIDKIKGKSQQEIELLKEYKTALISEVVTGKVDVREEKIN